MHKICVFEVGTLFTMYIVTENSSLKWVAYFGQAYINSNPCSIPDTLLISTPSTLFPGLGSNLTTSCSFARWNVSTLSVPPEECSAGVAGYSSIVQSGLRNGLVTHLAL